MFGFTLAILDTIQTKCSYSETTQGFFPLQNQINLLQYVSVISVELTYWTASSNFTRVQNKRTTAEDVKFELTCFQTGAA